MNFLKGALVACVLTLAIGLIVLAAVAALAQTAPSVSDVVGLACADNGARLTRGIAWVGGAIGASSLIANFRSKIPAPLMSVIDAVALNWIKSETSTKA
jgi:hypothetical protein